MFRLLVCLLPIGLLVTPSSWSTAAEWKFSDGSTHHIEVTRADKTLMIKTTGNDPYLVGRLAQPISTNDRVLEIEYFCPAGIEGASIYYGPPITAEKRISLPRIPVAEGWATFTADLQELLGKPLPPSTRQIRLDLGDREDVRIQIRSVKLRPQTVQEIQAAKNREAVTQRKQQRADAITEYLNQQHNPVVQSVLVNPTHVIVKAKRTGISSRLTELRPHQDVTENGLMVAAKPETIDSQWVWRLPRRDGSYDRVQSAWRLEVADAETDQPTARHYASTIESSSSAPRLTPRNQKGITSLSKRGPLGDFVDLDISAATINLVLGRFVSSTPGANRTRIPAPGKPVYFNATGFRHYDPLLKFARQHKIVVSAIVLVTSPRSIDKSHVLVHPENSGGVYAMPDLSSPRGAAVYAYVLDRIAAHYRPAEDSPGVITNWIAHNEIDYHTMWTNMGRQPAETLTETYYRSMRLIYNASRMHNPNARVFASLTHNWNVPQNKLHRWEQLSPRDFLTTLQRYSDIEGDFEWGVAYHPYPQSLFAKVAWADKRITNDFDSPLVTMQNLEVLGRFLQQPSMLYQGKMRGVLLSEQGFHSQGNDNAAQDQQAASLLWAMNRLQKMPWVESFIYHRWIDHPKEGGLMLGLRTLPTAEHPHGEKKRSWYVYQAIGTDQEAEATEGLPRP